jgi:hypothetical protein
VTQSLGKMFCGGAYDELPAPICLQFHYPREGIVHGCSRGFLAEQMLDLVAMRRKEIARDVNKPGCNSLTLLLAGWAYGDCMWMPALVLAALFWCPGERPTPIGVNRPASAAFCRFAAGTPATVSSSFVVNSLRIGHIRLMLVASHDSPPFF